MKKHRMKILLFLTVVVILVWVTGYATMSEVTKAKDEGKGTSQVYPVNADQAWEIAMIVFR